MSVQRTSIGHGFRLRSDWRALLVAGIGLIGGTGLQAQWKTQEIELTEGKNAVFLTVQPEPREWDVLLQNEPRVERVWMWNRRFSSIQFTVSPDLPLGSKTDWQVWMPRNHPQAFLRNLSTALGNMAYIIEVPEGTPNFLLRLKGKPVYPVIRWQRDVLNFVGFHLNPESSITMQEFFSHSEDISNTVRSPKDTAFEYVGGELMDIRYFRQRTMKSGRAYWIRGGAVSDYTGPIGILPSSDPDLDFGTQLTEREVHFRNESPDEAITITILKTPSELPPHNVGQGVPDPNSLFIDTYVAPEVAGRVPLSYYDPRILNNAVVGWVEFQGAIIRTLQPGEVWRLRFAVRRADFTPYTPIDINGATYQDLLIVEDSLGINRYYLPVSATTGALSN